jgi:hypothetical protein
LFNFGPYSLKVTFGDKVRKFLPSAVAMPPDLLVISFVGQMSGLGFGGTGDVAIGLSW